MVNKILVTQIKSAIKKPKDQKATLASLGCKKLHRTIEKEDTPEIMGMIAKVKHLVKVENK